MDAKTEKKERKRWLRYVSVTRFLFITTQLAALSWVSGSFLVAAYVIIRHGEVASAISVLETLADRAMITILGAGSMKMIENIFEHNNGSVFGVSSKNDDDPPMTI